MTLGHDLLDRTEEERVAALKMGQIKCSARLCRLALQLPLSTREKLLWVGSLDRSDAGMPELVAMASYEQVPAVQSELLRRWAVSGRDECRGEILRGIRTGAYAQRSIFTLVERSMGGADYELMGLVAGLEHLLDYSDLLHAILLQRAGMGNLDSDAFDRIAALHIERHKNMTFPKGAALVPSIFWAKRCGRDWLQKLLDAYPENCWASAVARMVSESGEISSAFWAQGDAAQEEDDSLSELADCSEDAMVACARGVYGSDEEHFDSGPYGELHKAWAGNQLSLDVIRRAAFPKMLRCLTIRALGDLGGEEGTLGLLDYVNTSEYAEQAELVVALANCKTEKATRELIICLTKQNFALSMRERIVELVCERTDLDGVQTDLENVRTLLSARGSEAEQYLADSLSPVIPQTLYVGEAQEDAQDLEEALDELVSCWRLLPLRSQKALRSGVAFYQMRSAGREGDLDLSPVLDLQYKALELLFREHFEDYCRAQIDTGVLAQRLDLLGYARNAEEPMASFENYLNHLPIVQTIPYFSRFKLRRLLRSVANYKSGRRFTFDGLKAYALFFLAFSRKECANGLAELCSLPTADDEELFRLVKQLHVLQDRRNRAVHEGDHAEPAAEDWVHFNEICIYALHLSGNLSRSLAS